MDFPTTSSLTNPLVTLTPANTRLTLPPDMDYEYPHPPMEQSMSSLLGLDPSTSPPSTSKGQGLHHRLLGAVVPGLPETITSVRHAADAAADASHSLTQLLTMLREIFESIPTLAKHIQKLCDAIALIYDIVCDWLKEIYVHIPTYLYRLLTLFDVPYSIARHASLKLTMFFTPIELNQENHNSLRPELQGTEIETLFSTLSSFAGMILLSRHPSTSELKDVNEKLRFAQLMTSAGNNLGNVFMSFVQHLPDVVKAWAQYIIPTKWWLELFKPGSHYYIWMTQVENLDIAEVKERASFDLELQCLIRDLHRQGQQLLKDCSAGPQYTKIFTLLRDKMKVIDELFGIVDISSLAKRNRPVPFCCYLTGPAGRGKSFLNSILPPILAGTTDDTNLKYPRSPAVDHWDGYAGQFAVTYDDFYARKPGQEKPGEFAEIIGIVSNEIYPLPMAALEHKGATFRSRVVLISSNTAFPKDNSMIHAPALFRRRHVMYKVDIKPQFAMAGTGNLDVNRIPPDNSHYVIRKYTDPGQEKSTTGPPMSYQEFIRDVKQSYEQHVARENAAVENSKRMVENALKDLGAEQQGLLTDTLDTMIGGDFHSRLTQGIAVAGTAAFGAKYIPKWYRELAAEAAKEEPDWYKAVLTGTKLVATVCGTGWFFWRTLATHEKDKRRREAEIAMKPTLNKIQRAISEGDFVTDAEAEHRIRSALGCFRDVLTPEEIEKILDDTMQKLQRQFVPMQESAYGFTGKLATPRPMIVRPISEGLYQKPRRQRLIQKINPAEDMVVQEGSTDDNALQVASVAVCPALVHIRSSHRTNQGLFVKGRILLAPIHAFRDAIGHILPDHSPFSVIAPGVQFNDIFETSRMVIIGPDVCLYLMNYQTKSWRDITHHFWSDSDLMAKPSFDGIMITLRGLMTNPMMLQFPVERLDVPIEIGPDEELGGLTLKRNEGFIYDCPTRKGDCGGILLSLDTVFSKKIFGIHIAGIPKRNIGIASFISKEMIDEGIRKFNNDPRSQVAGARPRGPYQESLDQVRAIPQGNFTLHGQMAKMLYQSTKTKIIPSLIHGQLFKPLTAPSVLSHKDTRMTEPHDPMIKGVEKYGAQAVLLDSSLVERSSHHISDVFEKWTPHMPPVVVSLHEAINGNVNYEFADGIVMDTSAGFPYNQKPKLLAGKRDLFDGEPGNYTIKDASLRMLTEMRWQKALKGEQIPSLWLDCLKDERRDLSKISAGKTRVFTIPPLDFSLNFRRLTLAFSATFYRNALRFFSAVGMDPESFDWTRFYQRHARVSTRGFAGDYSGYDGNLSPQLIMECCEIINRWYDDDEEHQIARRVMFEEIVHTPQAFGNLVYQTHLGNPSGNPLTAIMNTIIGQLYVLCCWLELAPSSMRSLTHFEDNVVTTIYGDDIDFTVSKKAQKFFNPDNISLALRKMGMTFTAASKQGAAEWQDLMDLTFLKRGFAKGDNKRYLPLMDKTTIQELTNWVRMSDFVDSKSMLIDNCNNALRFAFFYGEQYFNELRDKIRSVLPDSASLFHDYRYYYDWFYSDDLPGKLDFVYERAEFQGSTTAGEFINSKGIINLSQRSGNEDDGSVAPATLNRELAAQTISDPAWTLPDISHREVLIDSFSWPTSSSFGTVIAKFECPQDLILAKFQAAGFERFVTWQGSMKIRIHGNGTRFHAGRLIAYFVPWVKKTQTPQWHEVHMAAAWSVPNVHVDAASNNPVTLNIPFYNPRSSMYINGPVNTDIDYTGTLILQVLSPLTAATGVSPAINVNMWVEFGQDQEFRIPANTNLAGQIFNREHHESLLKSALRYNIRAEQQGTTNSVNIKQEVYGNVDGNAIPTNMKGDEIGSGNDFSVPLPMDKPARPLNGVPVFKQGFQQLAATVGSEHVRRLDLNPSLLNESKAEMFSTMTDEMALRELLSRPTFGGRFSWSTSDTKGTMLNSRFIGPMSYYFTGTSESQVTMDSTIPLYPPLFDYLCAFFTYWRGSIKLRLDFVASQMHTGRVLLAAHYGTLPETDTTLRDGTSQYGVEIDLANDEHTFEFEFPQNVVTPWMRVSRGPRDAAVEYAANWFMQYFYGSWSLQVINELVTPDNVAPAIDIIWSVAGGKNFDVYYPGLTNETLIPVANLVSITEQDEMDKPEEVGQELHRRLTGYRPEQQGDTQEGTDAVAVPTPVESILDTGIVVSPSGAAIKMPFQHFGSRAPIRHIGEMTKRYVPVRPYNFLFNNPAFQTAGIIGDTGIGNVPYGFTDTDLSISTKASLYTFYWFEQVLPFSNNVNDSLRTPLAYFGRLFRFWRGSMRYKILWDGIEDFNGNPIRFGAAGVTFFPGPYLRLATGLPNFAAIANRYASVLENDYIRPAAGALGSINTNMSGLAIDASTEQGRYNEIEIPFTTTWNVFPTQIALSSGQANYQDSSPGMVLFVARFSYPGDTTAQTAFQTGGLNRFPRVWKAFGDEARFGTLLGPPPVQPTNSFYQASGAWVSPQDTWTVTHGTRIKKNSKPKQQQQPSTRSMIAEAAQLGSGSNSEDDGFVMTSSLHEALKRVKGVRFIEQQGLGTSVVEQRAAYQPERIGYHTRSSMFNARMSHYTLVGAVMSLYLDPGVLARAERIVNICEKEDEEIRPLNVMHARIVLEIEKTIVHGAVDRAVALIQAYEYLAKTFGFQLRYVCYESNSTDNIMLEYDVSVHFDDDNMAFSFRLKRQYGAQSWDLVRQAALTAIYERAHDSLGHAWIEEFSPSEMFFLTENIPLPEQNPRERSLASSSIGSTTYFNLMDRLRLGDRAEQQGEVGPGQIQPTTENIKRILTSKIADVTAKRKTNSQAWHEFKQVIPVKEDEKDTRLGPEHSPRYFHQRDTSCENRHWKDKSGPFISVCMEGSTKKEAKELSAKELLRVLADTYLMKPSTPREQSPDVVEIVVEPRKITGNSVDMATELLEKEMKELKQQIPPPPGFAPKSAETKPPGVTVQVESSTKPKTVERFDYASLLLYSATGKLLQDIEEEGPFYALCQKHDWTPIITASSNYHDSIRVWTITLVMLKEKEGSIMDAKRYKLTYVGVITPSVMDTTVRTAFSAFFSDLEYEFSDLNEPKHIYSLTKIRRALATNTHLE